MDKVGPTKPDMQDSEMLTFLASHMTFDENAIIASVTGSIIAQMLANSEKNSPHVNVGFFLASTSKPQSRAS
jgi:hypothetical protein